MPGAPAPLGPWPLGLTNRKYDGATLTDESLLDATNLVFDDDGNLYSRPPVVENNVNLGSSELEVVGWYSMPSDSPPPTPEVVDVLVVTNQQGTWVSIAENAWVQISTRYLPVAVQFYFEGDSAIWFAASPNASGTGGYWRLADTSVNVLSNIPQAGTMCVYSDRIWFSAINKGAIGLQGSYLIYSSTYPTTNADFDWNNIPSESAENFPGFQAIAPDDGGTINKILFYYDNIVVLKDSTTHLYSYNADILKRFQIKSVSPTVGTANDRTAVVVNDILYTLHGRYVYRFTGQSFTPVSEALTINGNVDSSLSEYDNNLLVRRGTEYYLYDLNINAWTQWATLRQFNWLVRRPVVRNLTEVLYQGGRVGQNDLVTISTEFDSARTEPYQVRLQTKYYDFGSTPTYKRLFAWGAYIKTNHNVRGFIDAVSELRETSTVWDEGSYPDVVSDSPYGYFYKFLKAYRFKQISFAIEIDTDGQEADVIYTIVPIIRTAQFNVGKQVTSV